jgi:hypothetical protein
MCTGTRIRHRGVIQSKNSTTSFLAVPIHLIGPCLPLKEGMFLNETITAQVRLVGELSNTVAVLPLSDERTRFVGGVGWGGCVSHPILFMSHPARRSDISTSSIFLPIFLHSNFAFTDQFTPPF